MAEAMKTYREGERFPGRVGRTWEDSEPAFPIPPSAPEGAPNVLYVVIDDIGLGWTETFGGLIRTTNIQRLAEGGLRYTSFCVGKWHNTPSEETSISGPYDRWPTGSVFGFDRFYGFLGGDSDQWYPKLFLDREAVDQPRLPDDGYHLSEDLVGRTISWTTQHRSIPPDKPWLTWLAFGAMHAPHHIWAEWADRYHDAFDMGWDAYREQTLSHQKQLGILPEHTQLTPMLEGIQRWEELSADERRLFARMAEVYAGFMEHTDAQIGRLVDALERTGQLDNTLLFVFIGDNGASGEGGLNGLFNEQSVTVGGETVEQNLGRIDQLGLPGSYNHCPVGWAMAGNTPFQLCKQYTHLGGVRNPLVVHWPQGIEARGELRHQYHHVTDIVPTILEAIGVEAPAVINSVQQEPVEGYAMNYSFDHAAPHQPHDPVLRDARQPRPVPRRLEGGPYHGRKPWENKAAWGFDEDHWELYNLNEDPSEANDLMKDRDRANLDDPMVKKTIELVGLWWAEAGKYQVLPLDDRFYTRALGREALYAGREFMTSTRRRSPPALRSPPDPQPLLGAQRRDRDPRRWRRRPHRRHGR